MYLLLASIPITQAWEPTILDASFIKFGLWIAAVLVEHLSAPALSMLT